MKKLPLTINAFIILCSLMLIFMLMTSSASYAEEPYLEQNRVNYISKVLQAFSETPNNKLFNTHSYVNVIENNNCRSSLSDLKVECLLSYAKNSCGEIRNTQSKNNCELYSDIIVVNKLSEKTFVNRTERYRMLKNTNYDFRTAMSNRLQQKYSRIITEFYLTKDSECDNKDFDCLAKGLEQFCLDYTNTNSLSWQYCMSASIWFIGISK